MKQAAIQLMAMRGGYRRRSQHSEATHAVFVRPVPDGPADASLDVEAGFDDSCIVLCLLLEALIVVRETFEFDVKLSVGHFRHARRDELIHNGLKILLGGHATDDKVSLQTDTVNSFSGVFHQLDELHSLLLLRIGGLDVVIIVVELHKSRRLAMTILLVISSARMLNSISQLTFKTYLSVWISSSCRFECKRDVVSTERLEEHGVSIVSVIIDGLVNDVPGVALPLVVASDIGDVSLQHRSQSLGGPCPRRHPRRQLRTVQKRVTSHDLAILLGKIGNDVPIRE